MKLFIIGNGFDLAHGLKTSYEDFRAYLQEEYPEADADEFVMPDVYTMPDGGEAIDDEDAVSFLLRIISVTEGDKWKDVETTLGLLDFSECFDGIDYERDSDGDINPWKQVYLNEDIASNLVLPTVKVTEYFSDWINTIDINNKVSIKNDFAKLVNPDEDLFLTFNYTETLEQVYKAKNVCHIHGKQGEEILFGHGNDTDYYDDNMSSFIGAENALDQIQRSLRKDTAGALDKHMSFFDKIDLRVDKVYSFGFSFSEVDIIYIQQICSRLTNPNIVWYLNDYDDEAKRDEYKAIIRRCGYKGRFSTYSVKK